MSLSVTLQEVHTHGTSIIQTVRELQQLRCFIQSLIMGKRKLQFVHGVHACKYIMYTQSARKHNNICRTYYCHRTLTLYLTVHFTAQICTNLQLLSAVWLEPPHAYLEEAVQNDPEHLIYILESWHVATQTLPSH